MGSATTETPTDSPATPEGSAEAVSGKPVTGGGGASQAGEKVAADGKRGELGLGLWVGVGTAGVGLVAGLVLGLLGASVLGWGGGGAGEEAGGGGGGGGAPPALVVLGEVRQEALVRPERVEGRLAAVKRSRVSAEIAGRVLEVPVEVGQRVTGGQTVLAEIDAVWAGLAVKEATARKQAAEARLQRNRVELAFLKQLATRDTGRQKELDDAAAEVAADEASVAAADAALARATEELERVTVLAPFDGYVVGKAAERGQWVEPGDAVVEVVSSGEIDAVIDVPESVVGKLGVGQAVEVTVGALRGVAATQPVESIVTGGDGWRVTGRVVAVNRDGGNAARTFEVKVRLENPGDVMKPGMSVTAGVEVGGDRQWLTVERDAVQFDEQGAQVWVSMPSEDGGMPMALPVPVEVVFGTGDRFAVEALPGRSAGLLFPGASVVTRGGERLFPTQALMVKGAESGGGGEPRGGDPPALCYRAGEVGGGGGGGGVFCLSCPPITLQVEV
ncbi:MAG: efflux RND transporter periplasmic adaptor subunit, partial [Planctomycetota bacterium]